MNKKFKQKTENDVKSLVLYGRHAVLSALSNPKRQINKILCTKENVDTIDNLPLEAHLALLREVIALVNDQI